MTRAEPAQSSTKNGSADAQFVGRVFASGMDEKSLLSKGLAESTTVEATDFTVGAGKRFEFG